MPKVSLDGFELYYEAHGMGEPLLLVPGLGGVGSYWQPNIDSFARDYQVIVHDHRGTGQSSHLRMPYSVEQMSEDLLKLMDHLSIKRAHLVGHSTGGAISQVLALTHPQRLKSLVIYASWTKADAFFARVFEARRKLLTESGPAAYVRATPVFLYPDWWINENQALLEERERIAIPAFPPAEIAAARIDAILAFDRSEELHRISTPTLVICAEDDFLTPPYFSRELARVIPGAELALLERGGHCASETVTAAFNESVLGFIGRHAG